MATINADTDALIAVMHVVRDGTIRIRLTHDGGPSHRSGVVLDDEDNVIGECRDYIYGAAGFSVWTKPFAGFVSIEQIEFVQ